MTQQINQELKEKILKKARIKAGVVQWQKNSDDFGINQVSQQIIEMPVDDLIALIADHYKDHGDSKPEGELQHLEIAPYASSLEIVRQVKSKINELVDAVNSLKNEGGS